MNDHPTGPRIAHSVTRQAALDRLDILDTGPEAAFDDLAQMAAEICDAPVALVSLVDAGRQWFKARVGTDLRETDLPRSVCKDTIQGETPLVIGDTTRDPRTMANPLNHEQGMRFYAGVPLRDIDGVAVGSLCVIDTRPRDLTAAQLTMLERLGRQVEAQLHLRALLADARRLESREAELRLEIDHRVRNSLQLVAAMLQLQYRGLAEDDPARLKLKAARNRVRAIASVHATLQVSDRPEAIRLDSFLETLVRDVVSGTRDDIEVVVSRSPATLAGRQLAALGIIVNEFVTNSLKHGFRADTRGRITAQLSEPCGGLCIRLSDDGVGRASAPQTEDGSGLGARIMQAAAEQLEGRIEWLDVPKGTALEVCIGTDPA